MKDPEYRKRRDLIAEIGNSHKTGQVSKIKGYFY